MTLKQLRVFVVVAKHEHVTNASHALDMAQSAVSKAIATLEGELEIRFFDRIGRNIKLTPLGAAFRYQAIELLDHVNQLKAWAIKMHDLPVGIRRPWQNWSPRCRSGSRPAAGRSHSGGSDALGRNATAPLKLSV